ncbi:VirD2 family relaxase/mobilization nuclease [Mesorhizobium sp. LSHC414A00]|uniref:relaxase/mobilization nuclease domain-containing protein n=1 Tax=Mesorhizobium sp. LSHC414A00 TaxID=1287287 RepID=UPI0003CE33D2|nr:VirD2 family relaxase/mobilization nuclease [Mesorhizobium sp. LSHC414A00]ESX79376.1 type VI secretion protein [Mesorhizobium sp. LSHC414A00]
MNRDDSFRVRPGRIRSRAGQRARPFIFQALAAAQRAGGHISRNGRITSPSASTFGRGRSASIRANRLITGRSRGVVVKARVVRQFKGSTPLAAHLKYLRREGVTRDGEKAKMFGPDTGEADHDAFSDRCKDDRHHFRFIVSPDDAAEVGDLEGFARDLMADMQRDLGTRLDWIGVDHWNTEHPHVHILVRGVADDGENLVISRDYISQGMRDRASDILTQTLGLRTDHDIRQTIERQIDSERWTQLDRQLVRDAHRHGTIDLAPYPDGQPDEFLTQKVGRLRKLESLSLANEIRPGQWTMAEEAETTLRALAERGDIIKRMHRSLTGHGIDRSAADFVFAAEQMDKPIIGRLLERGLDDELRGSAYAIVDGIDGRVHHIRFQDIDATGDSLPGSTVELRRYENAKGRARVALAVRSDLSIEDQVQAAGATWLDRQLVAREPVEVGEGGFGREVKQALQDRTDRLVEQGFARREGQQIILARNLVDTLRSREVEALGTQLAAETGLVFTKAEAGSHVAGIYRQRFSLASGRFSMIDDGLGFRLVPWSPSLDRELSRHVSGVVRGTKGIEWSVGRKRSLGV